MQVRAKELGYYGHMRRRPGTVFNIKSEKEFSIRWMEKIGSQEPAKAPASKKSKAVSEPQEMPEGEDPTGDQEVL